MNRLENMLGIFEGLGITGKYFFSVIMGFFMVIPIGVFTKVRALFLNEAYAFVVIGLLIFVNLILGVWKHLKLSTFSPKDMMMGLIEKLIICYTAITITLLIGSLQGADLFGVNELLIIGCKMSVAVYIAFSSASSMYVITKGKFPPKKWLLKLSKYSEEGLDSLLTKIK